MYINCNEYFIDKTIFFWKNNINIVTLDKFPGL